MTLSLIALLQSGMPPMMPPQAVEIAQSFFTALVFIVLGIPIIRALSRRFIERPPTQVVSVSSDVTARLERIEQAVEAVAIEVERIAEAQRFSAKLLAERGLSSAQSVATERQVGEAVPRSDSAR